jgi:hypothetical protein
MDFISENQRRIVNSTSRFKLINGCAGSHKTDTLVKCAVQSLQTCRDSIQFLTLVSSVTFEIKSRLESALGIIILKQGASNHYVGYYKRIPICISNFDSFVHLLLSNTEKSEEISDCYSEKVDLLLEELQKPGKIQVKMKSGHEINQIFLDESQDLESYKMQVLIEIGQKQQVNVTIAGDFLQTLFVSKKYSLDTHSMNVFKRLNPEYFDLNVCMRCPKAHVDFNNFLFKDIQKKYSLPPMEYSERLMNDVDKPFLFTHLKTSDTNFLFRSDNGNARINAEKITHMLTRLMEYDTTIIPSDVAIIMARSKNNELFYQLRDTLNKLYTRKGFKGDNVVHMSTEGDGYHNSLNWSNAKGKTVLISIHGDKGKGHKVVFFLGCTENSIPREIHVNRSIEIVAESLLNVATTRSTKYLFIGFTFNYPSRYLVKHHDNLHKYAYLAWKKETHESFPEPYFSIAKDFKDLYPVWPNHSEDVCKTGIKTVLSIKDDISKDFEQPKYLFPAQWKQLAKSTVFGTQLKIGMPLQEDHYMLLGSLTELLIQRILDRDNLFALLSSPTNIVYTEDERFLSFMYDIRNNPFQNFADYMNNYRGYFAKNKALEKDIRDAFHQQKTVLHSVFSEPQFIHDLMEFLSEEKSNEELTSSSMWNVALFHNQLTQKFYRPSTNTFINYFNEDLSILHQNINNFIEAFLSSSSRTANVFEMPIRFQSKFTKDELEELSKKSHQVAINGRCDIYNEAQKHLFEIKASSLTTCSNQWIIQAVMYAVSLYKPIDRVFIVNVLRGELWEWKLDLSEDHMKLENIVADKISEFYDWSPIETNALLRAIKQEEN